MAGNVIGTSSYSEAMDLSDLDDCGYDQESIGSPEETTQQEQLLSQQQHPPPTPQETTTNAPDAPLVKIRKKPGRKPNPASPALRKAQNRAAQRAFRERKERHMKDLESNIRGIKDHRDRLLHENEKMSSENEILKAENWYLKGIVLSLQLVCLQHNLVIPQHCPHVDEQTLSILNQSIPESIASYINVNSKNKLQISNKLMNDSPEITNIQLQQQQRQQQILSQQGGNPCHESVRQPQIYQPQPIPQQLPSGSLIITQDGVHTVPDKRGSNSGVSNSSSPLNNNNNNPQQQGSSWYHQQNKTQQPYDHLNESNSISSGYSPMNTNSPHQSEDGLYHGMPPLSPMSAADREKAAAAELPTKKNNLFGTDSSRELPLPHPVMLANEPVTSNLAAIQTLRLRLRLQSACVRMQSIPFAIQPTVLQLTIPHDPRIDLIPTPHMRDRMILYRDQFDLDDCFRCLLSGSVFHGGDPAIAGNWQLPAEFFEKYWFLTIDYNLRRYTNEWRKLQGLKEIKSNIIPTETSAAAAAAAAATASPPVVRSSTTTPPPLVPPPSTVFNHQQPQQHIHNKPTGGLSYQDLSGYLGVQLSGKNQARQSQPQQQQEQTTTTNMTPIQLTNGYGMMNPSNTTAAANSKSIPASTTPSTSAWDNIMMGQKNYDMMMTGLYNSNNSNHDMDQRPH